MRKVILGISAFNHDAAAALIIDGCLRGFLEEERVSEQKSTSALPIGAIKTLLKTEGLGLGDITDIAFYFDPKRLFVAYLKRNNPFAWMCDSYLLTSCRFIYEFFWMVNFFLKARRIPQQIQAKNAKMHFFPHHDCHIWYGIFASNKQEGIVISNDSVGEETSSIAQKWTVLKSGKICTRVLFSQASPHSIGYLYGAVTERLGFNRKNGAGKVMALAGFCKKLEASYFTDRIDIRTDGTFRFRHGLVSERSYKPAAQRLHPDFLIRYPVGETHNAAHYDLAYGVQKATEIILDHQVSICTSLTKNIVLTGGVAQNSVANGLLTQKYVDSNIIVPPVPHDSGCAIGAALLCAYAYDGKMPAYTDTAFLGTVYSDEEIASFLSSRRIAFKTFLSSQDCLETISILLTKGEIVGMFRGAMECGPRALGNRSILALPTITGITAHLNTCVKYREDFRPYGVIVCESKLHDYFDAPSHLKSVPYMTHVFKVRKNLRDTLKGVVHVDGTCRIQTVGPQNFFYQALFDLLEAQGLPRIIINTSLNVMGKPICRTLGHALSCFFTSGLDHIFFNEKYLVSK